MIEGKINCFDNIDYNILINIIKDKLKPDRTVIGLILKLLKAGYLLKPSTLYSGEIAASMPLALSSIDIWDKAISIGDIISPLLYNLYLTPLDDFIDKLRKKYEKVNLPGAVLRTPTTGECSLRRPADAGKGAAGLPLVNGAYGKRNIYYVRYVDT